jgi:hypothetical protein
MKVKKYLKKAEQYRKKIEKETMANPNPYGTGSWGFDSPIPRKGKSKRKARRNPYGTGSMDFMNHESDFFK